MNEFERALIALEVALGLRPGIRDPAEVMDLARARIMRTKNVLEVLSSEKDRLSERWSTREDDLEMIDEIVQACAVLAPMERFLKEQINERLLMLDPGEWKAALEHLRYPEMQFSAAVAWAYFRLSKWLYVPPPEIDAEEEVVEPLEGQQVEVVDLPPDVWSLENF